jgi:hypothetical protein
MSQFQKQSCRPTLLQKDMDVVNIGENGRGSSALRCSQGSVVSHPYLFQSDEPSPPYTTGEHLIRGCHTFSEVGEWVLGEWRMRKKRSQHDSFSMEKGVTPLCGLLGKSSRVPLPGEKREACGEKSSRVPLPM